MRSPDHNRGEARRSCFERGQVADATFVAPAGVIDHENVAGLRVFHRFEEDVDAAEMFRGKDTARGAHPGSDRDDPGGGNPDGKFQTHGCIEHERSGQVSELLGQRLFLHEITLRERSRVASANVFLNPPRLTRASHRHD